MKWPLVTRARYELLEREFERLLQERNIAYDARDRALDQLINRVGFEPVSIPVRTEMKEREREVESYLSQQFEDPGSGMIDVSVLQLANDLGGQPS